MVLNLSIQMSSPIVGTFLFLRMSDVRATSKESRLAQRLKEAGFTPESDSRNSCLTEEDINRPLKEFQSSRDSYWNGRKKVLEDALESEYPHIKQGMTDRIKGTRWFNKMSPHTEIASLRNRITFYKHADEHAKCTSPEIERLEAELKKIDEMAEWMNRMESPDFQKKMEELQKDIEKQIGVKMAKYETYYNLYEKHRGSLSDMYDEFETQTQELIDDNVTSGNNVEVSEPNVKDDSVSDEKRPETMTLSSSPNAAVAYYNNEDADTMVCTREYILRKYTETDALLEKITFEDFGSDDRAGFNQYCSLLKSERAALLRLYKKMEPEVSDLHEEDDTESDEKRSETSESEAVESDKDMSNRRNEIFRAYMDVNSVLESLTKDNFPGDSEGFEQHRSNMISQRDALSNKLKQLSQD